MTLGDIIKNYREQNNITLGDFANTCALSKGYISMLENNINPRNNRPISPTLPSMAKLATGMGIELDILLKMLDGKQSVQLIDDTTEQSTLRSPHCKEILDVCQQLSVSNRSRVLVYSKKLLDAQQMEDELLAAHARTDIEASQEDTQHDLGIMDDNSLWT